MRIQRLQLENIGPFIEADLHFMDDDTRPPVTLITGENGTGKSIILDAIRGMFGQQFAKLDRNIGRSGYEDKAHLTMDIEISGENQSISSAQISDSSIAISGFKYQGLPGAVMHNNQKAPDWIVDYWPSVAPRDSYRVDRFFSPKHKDFLFGSFNGLEKRSKITELICHFDYLRDSRESKEKAIGHSLYTLLEKIIKASLLEGGKLDHVARTTLDPIIIQNEHAVKLENLSCGNAYLIQNMVNLLGKMYSSHYLRQTPVEEIGQTPGLLLIDEAENQLHPKWQKRFLQSVLDIFPNLQIIATTHSPFIISSVSDARLFVCQSKQDHCVVEDVTDQYSNQPVDQILMSPLFEATQPFSQVITELLEERKEAIEVGDNERRNDIENTLLSMNSEYFSYFNIDKLIASLQDGNMNK